MRAIVYTETGGPDVLRLVDREVREPGPGEVRVRIRVSGVNPTDWKTRSGVTASLPADTGLVPHQDGAGDVEAVGSDVTHVGVGDRVWVWEAAYRRADGTAQEQMVVPAEQVVALPPAASYDVGASLGVPALTAHRCLTVREGGPERVGAGTHDGLTVLVAGGAGAVGHAAIQLARWAGASVVATVSGPEKAELAHAAGASAVVNYRDADAADQVRAVASDGVDLVVEVAPGVNAGLDAEVVAQGASVAVYANDGAADAQLPVRPFMGLNTRWQFVLLYTVPRVAKDRGVEDVSTAVAAGALPVGAAHGLPLHRYDLADTAAAHAAVEAGAVGKVLVDL